MHGRRLEWLMVVAAAVRWPTDAFNHVCTRVVRSDALCTPLTLSYQTRTPHPPGIAERIYVIIMMVVGLLWGAMIISNMTAIMQVRGYGGGGVGGE